MHTITITLFCTIRECLAVLTMLVATGLFCLQSAATLYTQILEEYDLPNNLLAELLRYGLQYCNHCSWQAGCSNACGLLYGCRYDLILAAVTC